ncbi:MAG: 50S ribosome-binding GTPase [Nanoarchaeota archaeon]|nr:50S ribosome-binding GTPase [Nanoarchaeota archaeon]
MTSTNTFGKAKPQRGKSNATNQHRMPVPEMIRNIIENSDIILEVLDARFIDKTRHPDIEKKIEDRRKKLIYVLNKSDLIDVKKAGEKVELDNLRPSVFFSSKERSGLKILRSLIKKEARKMNKDAVNVGIIGYPNSGKSSLINSLIGRASAKVSSISGFTKAIQKIKLSTGIYLIDTPGIIHPEEKLSIKRESSVKHSQIGAIDWNKTKEPELVVDKLMKEYPGTLENHYKTDANGDSELLIDSLGRKLRYLKKKGEVDETRTAKHILRDWQEGKIKI